MRSILKINKKSFKLFTSTTINATFLNDRVKRFIRNNKFDTRYISIITKISADNDRFWRSIGRRYIIDLNNKDDVNKYVNMLKNYILQNGTTEDWYNSLHPEKLVFEWINLPNIPLVVRSFLWNIGFSSILK